MNWSLRRLRLLDCDQIARTLMASLLLVVVGKGWPGDPTDPDARLLVKRISVKTSYVLLPDLRGNSYATKHNTLAHVVLCREHGQCLVFVEHEAATP